MVLIPTNTNTTQWKLDHHKIPVGRRSKRLGMSELGEECRRRSWYKFRWANVEHELLSRVKRIFSMGDYCEGVLIQALEDVGITITETQKGFPGSFGHAYGYIDGIALNVPEAPKTPHLFEGKSMNKVLFAKLKRHGLQITYPKHWVQCQRYMKALKLTRCLYVAICKDNSEIFIIRFEAEEDVQREAVMKEMELITTVEIPDRRWDKPEVYGCKFCPNADTCWNDVPMDKNCRTCKWVEVEMEGKWSCNKPGILNDDLAFEFMKLGCDSYETIPDV